MEITNRYLENCLIVDLTEAEFCYPKTLLLKNHVASLLAEGYRRVVLNMAHVDCLDSSGIAVLVSLFKTCREQHGKLTLFGLSAQANKLMELTHMDRVLEIWESESQAVLQVQRNAVR